MQNDFVTSVPLNRRAFVKSAAAAGLSLRVGLLPIQFASAATGFEPRSASGPRLFLDDEMIAELKDLRRVLHQPHKAGLIQESDGRPWELGDQISVVRDLGGRFHMTYRFAWPDPS